MEDLIARSDAEKAKLEKELEMAKRDVEETKSDFESAINHMQSQVTITAEDNNKLAL